MRLLLLYEVNTRLPHDGLEGTDESPECLNLDHRPLKSNSIAYQSAISLLTNNKMHWQDN